MRQIHYEGDVGRKTYHVDFVAGFSGTPSDFLSNLSRKNKNKYKTVLVILYWKNLATGLKKKLQVVVMLKIAEIVNKKGNNGAMPMS